MQQLRVPGDGAPAGGAPVPEGLGVVPRRWPPASLPSLALPPLSFSPLLRLCATVDPSYMCRSRQPSADLVSVVSGVNTYLLNTIRIPGEDPCYTGAGSCLCWWRTW